MKELKGSFQVFKSCGYIGNPEPLPNEHEGDALPPTGLSWKDDELSQYENSEESSEEPLAPTFITFKS